jgi:hypothetical protein
MCKTFLVPTFLACAFFVPSISNADETNSVQPDPALQTISLGETNATDHLSDTDLTASPGSHLQTVFVSANVETESAPIVSAPIVEILALALFTIVAFVLGARYAYRISYR